MTDISFLHTRSPGPEGFVRSSFTHRDGASSDVIFFPSRERWQASSSSKQQRSLYVFLPGNPGLLPYYIPFLSRLSFNDALPSHTAILAIGHVGHAPNLAQPKGQPIVELPGQVEAKLEIVDAVWEELVDQAGGRDEKETMKICVGGHSVGAWMACEMMKARPDRISSLSVLFPTLSHIGSTPNGRMLSPIFHTYTASFLSYLAPVLSTVLSPILPLLFPPTTLALLSSRSTILAALTLARSEMALIRSPDLAWFAANRGRIWGYWGKNDGWVQGSRAEEIMEVLKGSSIEVEDEGPKLVRVWECVEGLPHAFCLQHGEVMAEKVAPWLAVALQ